VSTSKILDAFDRWTQTAQDLVLVTVFETEGSTYSKAGHRILIAANGDFQGLVSGGCLEGDLAEHARRVITDGITRAVTYDLRDDADEIWGLGVGCNGLLRVLLQRLHRDTGFEPMRSIAAVQRGAQAALAAVVVGSSSGATPLGATALADSAGIRSWGMPERLAESLLETGSSGGAALLDVTCHDEVLHVLIAPIQPMRRLLLLGAGPDALPILRIGNELGWRTTVADHRPAYLEKPAFGEAEKRSLGTPGSLADRLRLDEFDAVVIMSHNLDADRIYLQQVGGSGIDYVGLLGPRARRDRLVAEIGEFGKLLASRLRGPVGLDIGANSPESIALSILAEIHRHFLSVNDGPAHGSRAPAAPRQTGL
jgi:xanthine dehydrogenase accessory factor